MGLTASQIGDLIVGTQKHLGKLRWTNIAPELNEYIALPHILKKEKVQFNGGVGIQRNIMLRDSGAAQHVEMFQPDQVNIADVMDTISIDWRHTSTNYAISRREIHMNTSSQQIVDLVKVRRTDCMLSLANLCERTVFSSPAAGDTTTPYGLFTWINKYDGSNTALGFHGKKPNGWSTCPGGLDHERFRNYTGQFAEFTKGDLIKKMRTTFRHIEFKAPVSTPGYERGAPRRQILVNHNSVSNLEDLGENQNENIGRDLAAFHDKMVFRGIPIQWVPYLDNDESDPIYFVDWSVLYPVFLRGEYLNEMNMEPTAGLHTVFQTFIDLTWNMLCVDRRKLAVLSKTNVAGE